MKDKLLTPIILLTTFFVVFIAVCSIVFWPKNNVPALGGYSTGVTFFSATTTTATSSPATDIENAQKVTFFFQRGDTTGQGNTGTTTFLVEISNDNSNWITYNKLLDNVANTNSQQLTRVGSVIFSAAANYDNATGTKAYSMDLSNDAYKWVRCVAREGTDGEHTCKARIQY